MSYQTACGFIWSRGRDKLIWLREALNSGMSQREIARQLKVSESRVSQITPKLFRRVYVFRQGAIDALQFEHAVLLEEAATVKRNIEESLDAQGENISAA